MTFSILHWTAFAFSLGHYIFPDIQHLNTYLWCFLRLVLVVFLEPVRKGLLDCDWNFPSYQFSKSNSVKRILLVWHKIYHCWVVLAWSVERRQQYWAGKLRRRKLPLNIGSRKLNIQPLTSPDRWSMTQGNNSFQLKVPVLSSLVLSENLPACQICVACTRWLGSIDGDTECTALWKVAYFSFSRAQYLGSIRNIWKEFSLPAWLWESPFFCF